MKQHKKLIILLIALLLVCVGLVSAVLHKKIKGQQDYTTHDVNPIDLEESNQKDDTGGDSDDKDSEEADDGAPEMGIGVDAEEQEEKNNQEESDKGVELPILPLQ